MEASIQSDGEPGSADPSRALRPVPDLPGLMPGHDRPEPGSSDFVPEFSPDGRVPSINRLLEYDSEAPPPDLAEPGLVDNVTPLPDPVGVAAKRLEEEIAERTRPPTTYFFVDPASKRRFYLDLDRNRQPEFLAYEKLERVPRRGNLWRRERYVRQHGVVDGKQCDTWQRQDEFLSVSPQDHLRQHFVFDHPRDLSAKELDGLKQVLQRSKSDGNRPQQPGWGWPESDGDSPDSSPRQYF